MKRIEELGKLLVHCNKLGLRNYAYTRNTKIHNQSQNTYASGSGSLRECRNKISRAVVGRAKTSELGINKDH